jgi:hypothetical protein
MHFASAQRAVHTAQQALHGISQTVEAEIKQAKQTGQEEAAALKTVGERKMDIARIHKKQTSMELQANREATRAAMINEHALKLREGKASSDVRRSERNLEDANRIIKRAEKVEAEDKAEKPKERKLDMKKVEQEAEHLAEKKVLTSQTSSPLPKPSIERSTTKGRGFDISRETTGSGSVVHVHHHKKSSRTIEVRTHGADNDIHDQYADKVKALEKQRVEARDTNKEAKQELQHLKSKHASTEQIQAAKQDVASSAQIVKQLEQKQEDAIAQVVAHIQDKEPTYSNNKKKSPTDHH